MPETADVTVVGGGVIGCAVAYYLARAGVSVQLVERDAIGSQASGMAAGLLLPLGESPSPHPLQQLGMQSLELHRELAPQLQAETGINVHLRDTPLLLPAFTEEEAQKLQGRLAWMAPLGVDVRWVDGLEARRWEPALTPRALGALLSCAEAQLEPYPLVLALAQAAEKRGAVFHYREAIGLRRRSGGDLEVRTRDGALVSRHVVLALGPWSSSAGEWLDTPVPVQPQRGQLLRLGAGAAPLRAILMHQSAYLAPKANDVTVAGATEEDQVAFDTQVTSQSTQWVIENSLRLAPRMAEAPVLQALAGLRPISADGLPILGPAPGWERVYIATGHGRKGILLSAVTGKLLTDWITGAPRSADVTPFLASRFVPKNS